MFGDLDDNHEPAVPEDALTRAKATGAARVRRRYAIAGATAAVLLVMAAVPFVSKDTPKTSVGYTNSPTTESTDTTDVPQVVGGGTNTTSGFVNESAVPAGLFAAIVDYTADDQSAVVMRFDGSGRRVLVKGAPPYRPSEVFWSPDRTLLAITTIDTRIGPKPQYGSPVRLDVFDVSSGRIRTVYEAPDGTIFSGPTWSADSAHIAMSSGKYRFTENGFHDAIVDEPELRVVDVKSKESWAVPAARDVDRIVWSRDGSRIAFSDGLQKRTIHVVDVDARAVHIAVSDTTDGWSFSPDGRRVAFIPYRDGTAWASTTVEVVAADGSDHKTFSDVTRPGWRFEDPQWSPSSDRFLVASRSPATDGPQSVAVVDPGTSRIMQFEGFIAERPVDDAFRDTRGSSWDPHGDAMFLVKLGFFAIHRVPLDGSEPTAVTDGIVSSWRLSPAGDSIAWSKQNAGAAVRTLPGGEITAIGTADENPIAWSPDGAAVVSDRIDGDGPHMIVSVTRLDGRGHWSFRV